MRSKQRRHYQPPFCHFTFCAKKMNFGGGGYQSLDYKSSYRGGASGGSFGGGGGYRGGGGYMSSSGGGTFSSPGGPNFQSPSVGGDKKKQSRDQSVRPLTSAQLHSANLPTPEEPFNVDNVEVGQVVLVGEIVEVNDMPTSIAYKIDDRMGPLVQVMRWISEEEDSQLELQRRAACREGIYVKVIGHTRVFNKQVNVVGFHIRPIEDFNEVTHHLAECMFAHVALTKGLPIPKQFSEYQSNQQEQASTSVGGGSSWAPMATSTQIGGANYDTRMDSGLTIVQKKVLSVIGQSKTEHGLHINEVVSIVKNHGISDSSIKTALDFLCNEGHIYSTIDDEHFKSTEDF